jgi:uncharacterized protein (DUF952 family)
MMIYHIALPEAWAAFTGDLYRSASLDTEGFIHCSFADQLDAVIRRYYAGSSSIVVLEIDPDKLMSRVVNEPSTANEIYPHIYGPINRPAIVTAIDRHI